MDPETKDKSAFITHDGIYESNRMPFSLKKCANVISNADVTGSTSSQLEAHSLLH